MAALIEKLKDEKDRLQAKADKLTQQIANKNNRLSALEQERQLLVFQAHAEDDSSAQGQLQKLAKERNALREDLQDLSTALASGINQKIADLGVKIEQERRRNLRDDLEREFDAQAKASRDVATIITQLQAKLEVLRVGDLKLVTGVNALSIDPVWEERCLDRLLGCNGERISFIKERLSGPSPLSRAFPHDSLESHTKSVAESVLAATADLSVSPEQAAKGASRYRVCTTIEGLKNHTFKPGQHVVLTDAEAKELVEAGALAKCTAEDVEGE